MYGLIFPHGIQTIFYCFRYTVSGILFLVIATYLAETNWYEVYNKNYNIIYYLIYKQFVFFVLKFSMIKICTSFPYLYRKNSKQVIAINFKLRCRPLVSICKAKFCQRKLQGIEWCFLHRLWPATGRWSAAQFATVVLCSLAFFYCLKCNPYVLRINRINQFWQKTRLLHLLLPPMSTAVTN